MSHFPPPPNPSQQHQQQQQQQQRFPPPPGGGGAGGFAIPSGGASRGFAPPPPAAAAAAGGFARPGFAPPPGQHPQQPPFMQQQQHQNVEQSMAQMSLGGGPGSSGGGFAPPPPQPGGGFAPPPPGGRAGGFGPPPPAAATTGFAPLPAMGTGFAPPQQPQAGTGFAPPPQQQQPGSGFGPPPPGMMMPPPPGAANAFQNPNQSKSPFYQQPPSPGQMQSIAQPQTPGAMPQGAAPMQQQQMMMTNENIDYSIVIPNRICRWTAGKVPQTAAQASATKVPLGAVLRPLAPYQPDDDNDDILTVQPGTAGIVRCKRCRTYMNAFVTWSEHGRRWRCNICAQINDCPSAYFCHLDEQGLRRDRFERPELCKAVVEFIAPAEYMVRPPQEPTFFFVLDVSATAVRSGMLVSSARAIKASLDDLPGRGRTKIGFITFDNAVHYYNLSSELASPQMLVVSDLKELFVPLPDNLLVNLQESRAVVEAFLDSLPEMFTKNPVVSQSCLGPALKAAFTVMKQIGGKMSVFQSILPNLGDGALKPREQPGIMGTPNEVKLLKTESTWYKDTAIEFSRQQISVDLYLFPYQYLDLASLGELPKYASGSMHSYVNFHIERDGPRFESQLNKALTQTTAFEAVMRIRCTKGMRITNFYGNFFIRGTDLLALPNCNTESVYGFDLVHDEQNVASSHVTVQAALLYTSSDGERRIRVMTQCLPITSLNSDVIASIDTEACCALLAKQGLDIVQKSSLDNARMRFQQVCIDVIRASKGGDQRKISGYAVPPPMSQPAGEDLAEKPIPENLKLLPLYTLAMMKNVAFRGGTDVHPDERVQSHHLLNGMWVTDSIHFIYPRMFSIHNMAANAGLPADNGSQDGVAGRNRIQLPGVVNLSVDRLSSNGVYLLDNGVEMYLWVGRTADIQVLCSLFGLQSLDDVDPNQLSVMTSGDSFATRFGAIVQALREDEDDPYVISPKINVIREGDPYMEARFFWFLIEDRASFQGGTHSYDEFMQFVNNPSMGSGSQRGPPGVGPPGRGPPGGMPGHAGPPGGMPGHPGPPGPPGGMPNMPPSHYTPVQQGLVPNSMGGMPPPPSQAGPPPHHGGMPPPPNVRGPAQAMGMPPPGRQLSGPPPPMQGPPRSAPPAMPTGPPSQGPPGGHDGPPPPSSYGDTPPGAHSGGFAAPPSGQPGGGFRAPPQSAPSGAGITSPPPAPPQRQGGMPPPPGRAVPGRGPPPPPPRGNMPPPPPPRR